MRHEFRSTSGGLRVSQNARVAERLFREALLASGLRVVTEFVVGSFASSHVPISFACDLDLRAVVESPTSSQLRKLFSRMEEISQSLSAPDCMVQAGFRIGIQRAVSPLPSILLHVIVLREEDLASLPATHRRGYASSYRLLAGCDLLARYLTVQLTAHDVLSSPEGVRHCATMLRSGKLDFLEWDLSDDIPQLVPRSVEMDELSRWDVAAYSSVKCTVNAASFLGLCRDDNLNGILREGSWPELGRFLPLFQEIESCRRLRRLPEASSITSLVSQTVELLDWLDTVISARSAS
jgi:hypothetical protein